MKWITELWHYREMVFSLVKRDLKGRYKGSVMGFLWTLLNPLLQLMVYTFVFTIIMPSGVEKFYLFLFVALVPWLFFSSCLGTGTTVIFAQQEMVKKIYFPRQILPISFTISQFVNMLLSFVVIFVVVLFSGVKVNLLGVLCLPVVMIVQFVLCLGITFLVSALTVYFRDLEYILSIISMAWMYLTPILYPIENVPTISECFIFESNDGSYYSIYGYFILWENSRNGDSYQCNFDGMCCIDSWSNFIRTFTKAFCRGVIE